MPRTPHRRDVIRHLAGSVAAGSFGVGGDPASGDAGTSRRANIVDSAAAESSAAPVRVEDFNMIGLYDIGWLRTPLFHRVLDTIAASAPAFGSVRFFHALDGATPARTIDDDPLDGAGVWPDAARTPDFAATIAAIAELTSRGLAPFVCLNFFPRAVSAQAASPPARFDAWQHLIGRFLNALASDPRFGPEAMRAWHFEVWNEPNHGSFWRGQYDPDYLDLYRATAQAVQSSGIDVRLGGPAIVYRGAASRSRADMERFLRFLSAEPHLKCDFISLHAKGSWSPGEEPDLRSVVKAAVETAELALSIDRARFAGLSIINDEADMRVGFDIPYTPRNDEHFPAWLAAVAIAYDHLGVTFADAGFRFVAASDNGNQQLVRSSFDGRRALFTRGKAPDDLIKLAVFNFYEVLRLLGSRRGKTLSGAADLYPNSDLFHLVTHADSHVCSLFVVHPLAGPDERRAWDVVYSVTDLPWDRINVACFLIDARHSNAAQRYHPLWGSFAEIRKAQELALAKPMGVALAAPEHRFEDQLTLAPFTVLVHWITPYREHAPADPAWIETDVEGDRVILRWTANRDPDFYSYEVFVMAPGSAPARISPDPLRAAMWIDDAPGRGTRHYGVCAVTASQIRSSVVISPAVDI
jgi:hypothetical protein